RICFRMSNTKRAVSGLLFAVVLTIPIRMPAQSVSESNRPNSDGGGNPDPTTTTTGQSNAAILEELSRMRARIQELESQLKAQSAATPNDNQPTSALAQPTVARHECAAPASAVALVQDQAAAKPSDQKSEPFAFADFTWLSGNPRTKDTPYATKFFTPEIRFDANYTYDFNHPADNTIGGSSEIFRHNEFQLTQLGVGGDFHFDNVRGRLMTQFGMYSQTQPRNDASTARGQWGLNNAYQYLAEAYGGYHFNK